MFLEDQDRVPQVLIVEDDDNMITLLTEILFNEGYCIYTAKNGIEALDIIRNEDISLVVSDYLMPEMNGLLMVREAKKIRPNLEIILITGYGDIATHNAARDEGAFECFDKPLDIRSFRKYVKRAIFKGMFQDHEFAPSTLPN